MTTEANAGPLTTGPAFRDEAGEPRVIVTRVTCSPCIVAGRCVCEASPGPRVGPPDRPAWLDPSWHWGDS